MALPTNFSFDDLPALLTMRDLQDILHVSRQWCTVLGQRGAFPIIRVGERSLRVRKEDFLRFLDEQTERRSRA